MSSHGPEGADRKTQAATIVISNKIKPGCEDAYNDWQDRIDAAVKKSAGSVATERIRPVPGVQDEWTVIYRFQTSDQLAQWLNSDVRRELLKESPSLLAEPAVEHAMAGGKEDDQGVTMVIPHKVKPENEDAFLKIERQLIDAERKREGYRGAQLLEPVPGIQEEWTALVRFDTEQNMQRWLDSDERKQLTDQLDQVVESFEVRKVGSSFGSWFSFNIVDGEAVPNWKQAMAVLLSLYPIVMVETIALNPGLEDLDVPGFLAIFIGNAISVALLTWVFMPVVTRVLSRWLAPMTPVRITLVGLAAVVAFYGLSLLVFGLVT